MLRQLSLKARIVGPLSCYQLYFVDYPYPFGIAAYGPFGIAASGALWPSQLPT